MKSLDGFSSQQAARLVGASLICMFLMAIFSQFLGFANIIVVGDAAATISNIKASGSIFWVGVFAWLVIYALDVVVSVGLYVLFKSTNTNQAILSTVLRLVYTGIVYIGLIALVFYYPSIYDFTQFFGYVFFIGHLFVLGYLVYNSGFIPKWLGVLLMLNSFSYVILSYGEFFIPPTLYDQLYVVAMVPAICGELFFGIWLLLKANKLP